MAIAYWKLPPEARLRDVVLAVRQDESVHRGFHYGFTDALDSKTRQVPPFDHSVAAGGPPVAVGHAGGEGESEAHAPHQAVEIATVHARLLCGACHGSLVAGQGGLDPPTLKCRRCLAQGQAIASTGRVVGL